MNNIQTIWSNPHLRYAAVALVAIEVAAVWIPAYKPQLDSTKSIILMYALAAAANSSPQPPKTPEPPKQ